MMVDLDGRGPLYRQVYRSLRASILDGSLPAGARLPATRTLATESGLSRNTVLQAFEQLRAEGYVGARTGSGTYVASELPDNALLVGKPLQISERENEPALRTSAAAQRLADQIGNRDYSWGLGTAAPVCDFRYGTPAMNDVPISTWGRLIARRTRNASYRRLGYSSPLGAEELRVELSRYLRRSRGVSCDPDRIVLTHGSQQAVGLALAALVDPGDRVAVEEPCYAGFSLPLVAADAVRVSIATDENGMRVDELARREPVRLICVTPSHQFPGGGVMPLARRLELLEVARRMNAGIIEDDYDSEFRYDGRPIECLQGVDTDGRVVYLGSASKLMFPSLRIGWLVAPKSLMTALGQAKAVADTGAATIEQLAFADFIREGHLERHLRRSRVRNRERRDALLDALDRYFGDRARVAGASGGVHIALHLDGVPGRWGGELRRRCREQGVAIYPVRPYCAEPLDHAAFILGYASLNEQQIEKGVRIFAQTAREFEV